MSDKMEELESSENLDGDMVQEIIKSGTDLRQYSKQVEKELKDVEKKSIDDYIKECKNIASLHNQITACDNILERMEQMLLGFQTDLGSISSEILELQKKSVQMNQQLINRQSIKGQLRQFIEDIVVTEELITNILDRNCTDDEFLNSLQELNHKIIFVKEQNFKETKSCQDVCDILEKLKIKSMAKIRAYLLEQISKFRKPMTNYQVPQNAMLKYKFFFEFILSNERNVAQEICSEYVDTMSKIYFSYFKSYSSRLKKLKYEEQPTKDDLMGKEDTESRSLTSVGSGLFYRSSSSLKNKGTVFTIGNRGDVLAQQLEAPIIVPHAQQKNRYSYEMIFRSEQYALVDNACREYLFLCEFFLIRGQRALEVFEQVMGKTLQLLTKNLESYVSDCYDMIALFLCVQLILRYQLMCHKRAVPALDKYWDGLQAIIWPRFENVFRLNIQSIRDCDPTKFNKEMGPHYITRRYAEFSAAIVGISEHFPNDLVNHLLAELQEEVECFILRMAAIFPERKEQLIYLINNYDMVLSILMERTRDNSKEAEGFRDQLNLRSSEYVEEILSPHFGAMIQYIKELESIGNINLNSTSSNSNQSGSSIQEKQLQEEIKKREQKSLELVQQFSNTWKKSLEKLNREVLISFPSLVTGSTLLQLTLTQLVQYYHRFSKLLTPNARGQLTNIHHIMVELKKYKTNY